MFSTLDLTRLYTSPGVPSPAQDAASFDRAARSHFRRIGVRTRAHYAGGLWHDAYIFEVLRDEWREP